MGLLYPGALVFFALVPALVLAYLAKRAAVARDGLERAGVPRAAWFSARAFRRMAAAGLDVLRRGFDPESGGDRDGEPVHLETKFSARRRDRQFRRDAGADALRQDPFRHRARKARRGIVSRKWRRRNFRLHYCAAAATGRAAVHHADRSAPGAAPNQADRRAQRSDDAGELSQQSRVGSARREGDFRRRQRARGACPCADSSDCGRRRGCERRDRLIYPEARSPWRGSTSCESDHRQLQS